MKKIQLSFLLYLLTAFGHAQQQIDTFLTQQWSSGAYKNASATKYHYNPGCYTLGYNSFTWATTAFKNYMQGTNTLNANNAITYQIVEIWNDVTNAWENNSNNTYLYNALPQMPDTIIGQTFNKTTSIWENASRSIYTHNANGYTTSLLTQGWVSNNWENQYEYTYTYNGANLVTHLLLKMWNIASNQWENFFQYYYTYTSGNLLSLMQSQKYNTTTNTWGNYWQYTYSYSTNNKILTQLTESWNSTTASWTNVYHSDYFYAANDFLDSTIQKQWAYISGPPAGNFWVNRERKLYNNDAQGRAKIVETHTAYSAPYNFQNYHKDFYSYACSQLPIEGVDFSASLHESNKVILSWNLRAPGDAQLYYVQKSSNGKDFATIASIPVTQQNFYKITDRIEGTSESMLFYRLALQHKNGQVEYSEVKNIRLSSNDKNFTCTNTADKLYINYKAIKNGTINCKIFNAEGKSCIGKIFNKLVGSNIHQLDISNLISGVYFINIIDGNNTSTQKFMK